MLRKGKENINNNASTSAFSLQPALSKETDSLLLSKSPSPTAKRKRGSNSLAFLIFLINFVIFPTIFITFVHSNETPIDFEINYQLQKIIHSSQPHHFNYVSTEIPVIYNSYDAKSEHHHRSKTTEERLNYRPIIGILAQPVAPRYKKCGDSYIAASYVKFFESGGARIVPLMDFWSDEELYATLDRINGVVLPGGSVLLRGPQKGIEFSKYMEFQKKIFDYVVKENTNGRYYPLWGTCLGFEAIANAAANKFILEEYDAWNITIPLHFQAGFNESQLFSGCPPKIIEFLKTKPITLNNHIKGVSPDAFLVNPTLKNDYRIISLNEDKQGKVFVSAFEHKTLPIFATIFHPEKSQFEWNNRSVIDHSMEAIMANSYFSSFFVEKARHNFNHFPSFDEEWKSLIYSHQPSFRYLRDKQFVQVYYFSNKNPSILDANSKETVQFQNDC